MTKFSSTFMERFSAKIGPSMANGCREWKGTKLPQGYGLIRRGSAKDGFILAHRAAFLLAKGQIGDGMVVMHLCDNPSCVNPDHLSMGLQKDNVADMVRKNRHGWRVKTPWQKLSHEDALQIKLLRAQGWTQQQVADKFCVSRTLISLMEHGKLQYA